MPDSFEIKNDHGDSVGRIDFNVEPNHLNVSRTAAGFQMSIPGQLLLHLVGRDDPQPMVSNLWGHIFTTDSSGTNVEVGQFYDNSWYSVGWSDRPGRSTSTDIRLIWRGTFIEIAYFEKVREGRPPRLQLQLWGELCYLLPSQHPRHQLRTPPQRIYGNVTVTYPKEIWVQKLRSLGVLENVLVEIPLLSAPPAPWDQVWENVVAARDHFEQGGMTGWNSCVLSVRQALERWRDIEGNDTGPTDPTKRSKRERLNNLRQALHQCTHIWIHRDEDPTRDDALLMLSTLSALLAERKPAG